MKDRESVLARDLDRYRCQRRLLLTGTPLQNDLKELWSLLNLLLPEVFDNRKAFHDWFSKPFQKDGSSHSPEEDDWLETEKKVIVIHRLHQILEPFMLRRRVEDVEGSLPPKVSVVLRCRMSAMQGAIYDWIKSTGTIRVDPEDELRRSERNPKYQIKMYKNLNNKCMELRKACNHPLLNYPYFSAYSKDFLVRSCGKLWILDRILLKLQRAGHRVLLFSTMTKLLDILEEYLQWRRLIYRRIDGTTSLEDRESAIVDFNSPYSDCFIFLLSIRAAGRGLNLQSADTVVIYDPDPNPQNEEQAVARAHRIGQTREVKVIYMEAVVDKISSYQKEDELRNGGSGDSEDDLAGKDRYIGSVESLIRSQIQQYKIDMADEVINAGRFDQRTTHEERRMTLETLLHDEERYQETVHDVPSLQQVNRMIARSEEEVELFDQMDEELNWTGELMKHTQVPKWLRVCSKELNAVVSSLSKKPSKNILSSVVDFESSVMTSGLSSGKAERKRGQTRSLTAHKYSSYIEFDEDDGEGSDASSEEGNVFSSREEDRGIGEVEEEDLSGAGDQQAISNQLLEDEGTGCDGDDELEEGEIAVSGDSHVDIQQSGSWNHEHDDCQGEQVLQPKLKRKRSLRPRPTYAIAKLEARSDRSCSQRHSRPPFNAHHKDEKLSRTDTTIGEPSGFFPKKQDTSPSLLKKMNSFPTRGVPVINTQKSGGSKYLPDFSEDAVDCSRESWTCHANANSIGHARTKMSDSMQRKCKNVINKLQRRIDKEGCLIAPVIYDIWKTNDPSNLANKFSKMNNPFDLLRIDQRIENLEYEGVADFIEDVQSLLKNVVHYCKYSQEVKYEARKLHDIFFDIMKIAFPESDFREAKMQLTFPSPSQGGMLPRQGMKPCNLNLSKQPKVFESERDHSPPKPMTRTPTPKPMHGPRDQDHSWLNASKFEKESKQTPRNRIEPDGSLYRSLLTHPGDLVICKKKRKDRDKSMTKARMGPLSPVSQGRASPFSPQTTVRAGLGSPVGTIRGGPLSPARKVLAHPTQNSVGWVHSAMEEVQWARPVKRMRTDTGKRRPIQF
ncbi:hypothetical protein HPP92_022275 [Vanilla planifolia]|uniref:Uncharacterized protein n=1 Tax=Vanilla planifolia TaxID=51239 RepID=A0A835Q088_VANPL|nr:hypothetical protein HPP92_022275 [Vanilla planifolia]